MISIQMARAEPSSEQRLEPRHRRRRARKHWDLHLRLDGGPGERHGYLGQTEDVHLPGDPLRRLHHHAVVRGGIAAISDDKGSLGDGFQDTDLGPPGVGGRTKLGGSGRGGRRIGGHHPDPGARIQGGGDHGLIRLEQWNADQLFRHVFRLGEDGAGKENSISSGAGGVEGQGADPLGDVGREAAFPGVGRHQIVIEQIA